MKTTINFKRSLLALLPLVALLFMSFSIATPQTGENDVIITTKKELLNSGGVGFSPEDTEFASAFMVISFSVSTTLNGYEISCVQNNGPSFTQEQINLIKRAKRGGKVYIENIKARGPGGEIRNLGSITFKIK